MKFDSIEDLRSHGFKGFRTIEELQESACSPVPSYQGVYLIVRVVDQDPIYLNASIGGHFKGKNPSVSIQELKDNWVNKAIILYVGKAGGSKSNATLKKRIWQYMQFGMGKPIGHWGGRYIWQIEGSNKLLVCWKESNGEEPILIESEIINKFSDIHNKRPFANLRD